MYSIILTVVLLADNYSVNSSNATAVSTTIVGSYSTSATCNALATVLSKSERLEYGVLSLTKAQCIQVKDK